MGTIGVNVLSLFMGFVTSILTARILGPEGKGQFAIFLASIQLFTLLFSLGLQASITYYVSKNKHEISQVASTFLFFGFIATIAFFGLVRAMYFYGPSGFFLPLKYDVFGFQLLLTANFFMQLVFNFFTALLSGKIQFGKVNRTFFISVMLTLAIYIVLYVVHSRNILKVTVADAFAVNLLITTISVLIVLFYYFRMGGKLSFNFLNWKNSKPFFLFGGIIFIANVAQFLNYRLAYWIVLYYAGEANLGIYAVAFTLGQMIWLMPNSIATVLFPYISRGDNQKNAESTKKISRVVLFISIILGLALAVLSRIFIPMLYGEQFTYAVKILIILLFGIIPACSLAVIAPFFSGNNMVRINMFASLMGLVITVGLGFLLIPSIGLDGAAIGGAISYLATTVFVIWVFTKYTDSNLMDILVIKKEDITDAIGYFRSYFISKKIESINERG
jgi:O-antigen/teichoic acid export membrane protein